MSTDLEPVLQQLPADLAAEIQSLLGTARELADRSRADSTRAAYAADWRHFENWCHRFGADPLPAGPGLIAAYVSMMCRPDNDRGKPYALSTVKRRLAAIVYEHKRAGHPNPTADAGFTEVLDGTTRTLGRAQRRKRAVSTDDLRALSRTMGDRLIDARDRALLLVGYAGAFRRSELAAFEMADVSERPKGVVLTVRRSKRDQEAKGCDIPIVYGRDEHTCPVRAVRAWINRAGLADQRDGHLFRRVDRHGNVGAGMSPAAVGEVVQRRMAELGHDPAEFGGHSLRRGMATTAARSGASDRTIMRTTRHASSDSLDPYVDDGKLFDDPASGYLGL